VSLFSTKLARGVTGLLAVGLTVALTWSWRTLSRDRSQTGSLERQIRTLREETEQTAAQIGRLAQMNRRHVQPSSELLRLRGEVSRLSRELAELNAVWPTNAVSGSNRSRRDESAAEVAGEFEARKQTRAEQLSSVRLALNQLAGQSGVVEFRRADGQPDPGLVRLLPTLPWNELEILCNDSRTLRFLQAWHPDEHIAWFSEPLLDPAGRHIRTAICANGRIISDSEPGFYHGGPPDEATTSQEFKQFLDQGR
jgi:hypothetical protein